MRLEIEGLSKSYSNKRVLTNISWQLEKGVIHVVTGPNGSGKSTLLRLLSGLEKPTSGKIIFQNDDLIAAPQDARQMIGLVSADINLYAHLTPPENLQLFALLRGLKRSEAELESLLQQVQLQNELERPVANFSSGMKQRLKLAYALLHQPSFLFLDEPTTNLDQEGKDLVTGIIQDQKARGVVLLATNEAGEVERFGQQILRLG
jgi:heme exporter protein A